MSESQDKRFYEIFDGKQLQDVFEDIYKNSNTKKLQITKLINELRILIKTVQDATVVVPLIAQYLEISVRNDEHLIKLAEIVQRLIKAESGKSSGDDGFDGIFTEEEQQKLLEKATNYTEMIREQAKQDKEKVAKMESKLKENK